MRPKPDDAPPGAAEVEQAARLAAALDGREAAGADPEALAAAFLLQAVGAARSGSELAAARARKLERDQRAAGRRRLLVRVGAAAAALLLATVFGWDRFHRRPPSAALLAARERQATQAVVTLLAARTPEDAPVDVVSLRQGELLAALRAERFDSLRWTLLVDPVTTAASAAAPTPTRPGGRPS